MCSCSEKYNFISDLKNDCVDINLPILVAFLYNRRDLQVSGLNYNI
jgi:hypothetical protein